jgi:hypothetical protein
MPKTANIDEEASEKTVHAARDNGVDEKKLKSFIIEYEACEAKIDEINEAAVKKCQPHKDEQKRIAKQAAQDGMTKEVFAAKLRERKHLRKAQLVTISLNPGQRDLFDEFTQKLTDLELFEVIERPEFENDDE